MLALNDVAVPAVHVSFMCAHLLPPVHDAGSEIPLPVVAVTLFAVPGLVDCDGAQKVWYVSSSVAVPSIATHRMVSAQVPVAAVCALDQISVAATFTTPSGK